ncbi:MAG TPA: GNAT family N-acetyltransferase [Alphaproteobacteria bacterium]|nr:GNAT family N-acetyltransferase [Alphaproteobacteria bacterium]
MKHVFLAVAYNCPVLAHQPVHIVDEITLQEMVELNPYNDNISKNTGRSPHFPEFLYMARRDGTYFIISDNANRIVASLTLYPQPEKHQIELSQISVHTNYQDFGLASRLLHQMKDYLNTDRPEITEIVINEFKDPGNRWIRPLIFKMRGEFKAQFKERDTWTFETFPLRRSAPR